MRSARFAHIPRSPCLLVWCTLLFPFRSNDARQRMQRRVLAASIFSYLPVVDASSFDSSTGEDFTAAGDQLANSIHEAYPQLCHGVRLTHPRMPPVALKVKRWRPQQIVPDWIAASAAYRSGCSL